MYDIYTLVSSSYKVTSAAGIEIDIFPLTDMIRIDKYSQKAVKEKIIAHYRAGIDEGYKISKRTA